MKRFKNILYVYEESVTQESVISSAVSLAQNNQARLTVIDVLPDNTSVMSFLPGTVSQAELQKTRIAERHRVLESLIAPYQKTMTINIDVLVGIKFIEVIRAVLKQGYDLLIKASENPDYIEMLFGSEDMHLLRKCPCPVWMMKAGETSNYECIMAAIDVDHDTDIADPSSHILNQEILELASSLALSDFATLHLAHVWDAPDAGFVGLWADNPDEAERNMIEGSRLWHEGAMKKLTQQLRSHIGAEAYAYLSPQVHLRRGDTKKEIPALAKKLKVDLVVMGTVARTGIPGFIIGNTAEAILEQLQCSVLAIKPPGFVSPVK